MNFVAYVTKIFSQERISLREILARADESKTLPISARRIFHTQCVC